MSLRYEQHRALKETREFLRYILAALKTPVKIKDLRERASNCLHHFPFLMESGKPMWSQDPFTDEETGFSTSLKRPVILDKCDDSTEGNKT